MIALRIIDGLCIRMALGLLLAAVLIFSYEFLRAYKATRLSVEFEGVFYYYPAQQVVSEEGRRSI